VKVGEEGAGPWLCAARAYPGRGRRRSAAAFSTADGFEVLYTITTVRLAMRLEPLCRLLARGESAGGFVARPTPPSPPLTQQNVNVS
jgi:hypothetical protein